MNNCSDRLTNKQIHQPVDAIRGLMGLMVYRLGIFAKTNKVGCLRSDVPGWLFASVLVF